MSFWTIFLPAVIVVLAAAAFLQPSWPVYFLLALALVVWAARGRSSGGDGARVTLSVPL